MLHILIKLSEHDTLPDRNHNGSLKISQAVLTLGEACSHAARHSNSIILEKWINGSLPVFGYFHAHYLFSSAMVLAMSSLLPIGNPSDMSAFETALEVLRSLSDNGNLAALEFFQNLDQVKGCIDNYQEERKRSGRNRKVSATAATGPGYTTMPSSSMQMQQNNSNEHTELVRTDLAETNSGNIQASVPWGNAISTANAGGFTTEMAFLEPTMQDFLAQSDFDLGLTHPVDSFMIDADSLYTHLTPSLWTE
jgi:hypothetical protein